MLSQLPASCTVPKNLITVPQKVPGYASLPACGLGERRIYRNQTIRIRESSTNPFLLILFPIRLRVLALQQIHHRLAPVVQPLQLAGLEFSESVGRDQRQGHGRIEVTDDRARQLVGIDLAPTDRLA